MKDFQSPQETLLLNQTSPNSPMPFQPDIGGEFIYARNRVIKLQNTVAESINPSMGVDVLA
jgi:hypothetical protein